MSEILDHLAKKAGDVVPPQQEATEAATQHEVPSAEDGAEDIGEGYKIGDRTFKTQDEAFAYAATLEQKMTVTEAQANAYRQAIQDTAIAQTAAQNVTQAPTPEDDDLDAKFFEDPKKFLKEYGDKIAAGVEARIHGQLEQKSTEERLWSDFFSDHPELRDFREDCESVLAKHTQDIRAINQTKGQKAAMDFLAQKTKAKFQQYLENTNPRRELPRTNSGPSMGSTAGVTRNVRETPPVDFITELRQAKAKRG